MVVSACVTVDDRSSSKLTHSDNERAIQQAAIRKIADERRHSLVEAAEFTRKRREDVRMHVPSAIRHGDKSDACFDEPSCQQATLSKVIAQIRIPDSIGFLTKIERLTGF